MAHCNSSEVLIVGGVGCKFDVCINIFAVVLFILKRIHKYSVFSSCRQHQTTRYDGWVDLFFEHDIALTMAR